VSGSTVIRREIEDICAGEPNGFITLRYSRYPGCSSNTISLSKVSLGSVSKALVNAPGPREPRYGKGGYINESIEKAKAQNVPGKASIMIFGAPFAARAFPSAASALRRGFVHLVKPSARALADRGSRIEILSRSPTEAPIGLKIALHSDWSGNGGRADRGVSSEKEAEGEVVEVEYGEGPGVAWRIRTLRVEGTNLELKDEEGMRLSDDLETRAAESIDLRDLHVLEAGGRVWVSGRSRVSDGGWPDRNSSRRAVSA
jgi:hypothetical protein